MGIGAHKPSSFAAVQPQHNEKYSNTQSLLLFISLTPSIYLLFMWETSFGIDTSILSVDLDESLNSINETLLNCERHSLYVIL